MREKILQTWTCNEASRVLVGVLLVCVSDHFPAVHYFSNLKNSLLWQKLKPNILLSQKH